MLRRVYRGEVNYPHYNFIRDGVYIGNFSISFLRDGTAQLWSFTIRPEFRGQGFGKAMAKEAVTLCRRVKAKRIWLSVFTNNQTAKACYRAAGFRIFSVGFSMSEGVINFVEKPTYIA